MKNNNLKEEIQKRGKDFRPSFDELFMLMTLLLRERSTCLRTKQACIIVSEDLCKIVAFGYNGAPKKIRNHCKSLEPGKCACIHAEANALIHFPFGEYENCTLYCTQSPCEQCAGLIINSNGIKKVVYYEEYRDKSGLELLKKGKIKTEKFKGFDYFYNNKDILSDIIVFDYLKSMKDFQKELNG